MTKKPLTKGRQKITMNKIKNKNRLSVTFSKRRNGLFKKASELVTLCGVQLALLVFSPGNKVYSFGSPNVYAVIDRFLSGGHVKHPHGDSAANQAEEEYHKNKIKGLNARLQEIERAVEAEKSLAVKLKEQVVAQTNIFAVTPRDQLNYSQLLELRGMLEQLKSRISSEMNARLMNNNIVIDSNVQNNVSPPLIGQDGIMFNNFGGNPGPSNNYNFGPSNFGPNF